MHQGEAIGTESPSSSSGMISFEIANGQPYGPHVPIAIDDDQYVEYSLDNMTEFPRNLEEEERVGQLTILLHAIHFFACIIDLLCISQIQMVMEAIVESLKDMGTRQSPEELTPCTNSNVVESSQENHTPIAPTDKESCESSKTDSTSLSSTNSDALASQSSAYNTDTPSEHQSVQSDKSSPKRDTNTVTPAQTMESSSNDSGDGTKATLTVEKNSSAGNIMDGFFRRWDRGFFKSSR